MSTTQQKDITAHSVQSQAQQLRKPIVLHITYGIATDHRLE